MNGVSAALVSPAQFEQLRAGLAWLFDTAQPDGAIVQHHGHASAVTGSRFYGFCPAGHAGRPIITVDVAGVHWLPVEDRWSDTLHPGEVEQLAAALTALGRHPVDSWNGHPTPTGSVELDDPIHPALAAATARYRAGCPDHPRQGVFCRCEHRRAGYAAAVHPAWPGEPGHAEVPR